MFHSNSFFFSFSESKSHHFHHLRKINETTLLISILDILRTPCKSEMISTSVFALLCYTAANSCSIWPSSGLHADVLQAHVVDEPLVLMRISDSADADVSEG